MSSPQRPRKARVTPARSHRAFRILLTVTAVSAVIAIAPHLRSATAANGPTFTRTNLVSDVPGVAGRTDPALVNPWGLAVGLNGGIWISDNGSGQSSIYDGAGQPIAPQTITIPAPGKSGGKSSPTGVATNATTGFVISAGGKIGSEQ